MEHLKLELAIMNTVKSQYYWIRSYAELNVYRP